MKKITLFRLCLGSAPNPPSVDDDLLAFYPATLQYKGGLLSCGGKRINEGGTEVTSECLYYGWPGEEGEGRPKDFVPVMDLARHSAGYSLYQGRFERC